MFLKVLYILLKVLYDDLQGGPMNSHYYTVDQISEILDMHPKTIRRFIREGKLHASRVGKQYRISGHDLSVFTGQDKEDVLTVGSQVSTVVDLDNTSSEEAAKISNMLIAATNQRGVSYGKASIKCQYIKDQEILRIMLWGSIAYMRVMLESIELLVGDHHDNL